MLYNNVVVNHRYVHHNNKLNIITFKNHISFNNHNNKLNIITFKIPNWRILCHNVKNLTSEYK
jgi:hypothetical protein